MQCEGGWGLVCTASEFWTASNDELFIRRGIAGIYAIHNMVNRKRYVGSAVSLYDRLYNHIWHLQECDKHRNIKLLNAWRKYKLSAFSLEVLEIVESPECLIEREQFWIDKLDAVASGYNLSPKAGSNLGRTFDSNTRQKIATGAAKAMADPSVKARHKKATSAAMARPEVKRKCSEHLKKRWQDPQQRSLLMRRFTPELLRRAALKQQQNRLKKVLEGKVKPGKLRAKPKYQIYRVSHPYVPTSSILFNLKEFCLEHSISYSSAQHVAKGRMRHVKGFVFERIDEWQ